MDGYTIISIAIILMVLEGIRLMNSPRTAVIGNTLIAAGILGVIVLTIIGGGIIGKTDLWVGLAVGTAFGVVLAMKVTMTQMPQLVALLNGLGGGASMLIALMVIGAQTSKTSVMSCFTAALALSVGSITLSGSLIAAGKLDRRIRQTPVILNGHTVITQILLAGTALLLLLLSGNITGQTIMLSVLLMAISLMLGVLGTLHIGGADMPITISLLNSLSGLAAAIVGLAIADLLLIAVGAIVGAGGIILTIIMCRAMNRRLWDIMNPPKSVGKPGLSPTATAYVDAQKDQQPPAVASDEWLRSAKTVVIVPGYGMALAQAQQQVGQLCEILEEKGKNVVFAIHPVAGRMPGHMNILLAEAGIPYDKLCDLEQSNTLFQQTDLVIVIGANDVINSAARTAEGTPIYGMPILNVDEAERVIICNKDRRPGYAGVANPLYDKDGSVLLLLGNATETVKHLTDELKKFC
ncbi:MAG: NAD(P)(+) transhydrogenase (Re/Si-specific) subunit beta [Sedimentisphaerales bacterium]|nr:NAD(P)(+) transhydrogenase (Re/Si-specific) subunit beta [Sedimentisphaerales bacterium]